MFFDMDMTHEGFRDWIGSECKQLVSFSGTNWKFAGLDFAGLKPFEIDVGQISAETKNFQKISDLVAALDSMQFRDCQRRKKWHERLEKEEDPSIRMEITKRILDSEDKALDAILEIVRLLKGTKSISEKTNESFNTDQQIEELFLGK